MDRIYKSESDVCRRLLLTYLKTVPALKGFYLCLRNQNWVSFSNYMFWTNEHGRSSFIGLIHRSPTQQIISTHPLLIKLIYHQPADVTRVNPLPANLFKSNFHSLEVVSRWRDPQLQVSGNYSDLTKWRSTIYKSCWLMSRFIFNMFKADMRCANKKCKNTNIIGTGGLRARPNTDNSYSYCSVSVSEYHRAHNDTLASWKSGILCPSNSRSMCCSLPRIFFQATGPLVCLKKKLLAKSIDRPIYFKNMLMKMTRTKK